MCPTVIFPKLNGPRTDRRVGGGHNLSHALESVPWTAGVPSCWHRAKVGAGLRRVPWARGVSHSLGAAGFLPSITFVATFLPNHPVSKEKYFGLQLRAQTTNKRNPRRERKHLTWIRKHFLEDKPEAVNGAKRFLSSIIPVHVRSLPKACVASS